MSFGVDISKLTQSKRLALEVQTRLYLQFFREDILGLHSRYQSAASASLGSPGVASFLKLEQMNKENYLALS